MELFQNERVRWQQRVWNNRRNRRDNRQWLLLDDRVQRGWIYQFGQTCVKNHLFAVYRTPTDCCECCNSLLSCNEISLPDLRAAEENCRICALVLRMVDAAEPGVLHDTVKRKGDILEASPGGRRILRLCFGPDDIDAENQLGFPAKSFERFGCLRGWLEKCDQEHDCMADAKKTMPTRLIFVGNRDDNERLVDVGDPVKYIALSHRWGNPKDAEQWNTTNENFNERKEKIELACLPQTFQDALEVARELRIPYLWIDSICIIQGDTKDWERESARMEDVFASAYCTIAATSAKDSSSGFLKRKIETESVYVRDSKGRQLHVCTGIPDFHNEVEMAPLNKRGWVMQERLLSRRTIHFGESQAYWECGQGICCEDSTRMSSSKNSTTYYGCDPKFPTRLMSSGYSVTLKFIQSTLENYSKRHLTIDADRAAAISGLEARIAYALDGTTGQKGFGIFKLFLHRTLLWHRSDGQMDRIDYGRKKVPSWSWMAYRGGIKFVDIYFGGLEVFRHLLWDGGNTLITNVWAFEGCTLKGGVILQDKAERGWITYDVAGSEDLGSERSVVLGRRGKEYYVLIVKSNEEGEYERVGFGMVQEGCILRQSGDVRII